MPHIIDTASATEITKLWQLLVPILLTTHTLVGNAPVS